MVNLKPSVPWGSGAPMQLPTLPYLWCNWLNLFFKSTLLAEYVTHANGHQIGIFFIVDLYNNSVRSFIVFVVYWCMVSDTPWEYYTVICMRWDVLYNRGGNHHNMYYHDIADLPTRMHLVKHERIVTSKYAGTICLSKLCKRLVKPVISIVRMQSSSLKAAHSLRKTKETNHSAGLFPCFYPNIHWGWASMIDRYVTLMSFRHRCQMSL